MSLDSLSRYDDAEDEMYDGDYESPSLVHLSATTFNSNPPSQPTSDVESGKPKKSLGLVSYIGGEYSDNEDSGTDEGSTDESESKTIPKNTGLLIDSLPSSVGSNSPSSGVETIEQQELGKEPSDGVRLPPEPEGRCSKSLQEKIVKMMEKKNSGMNVNEYLQRKKEFRNPSIYEKLVSYTGIDEHGTNFPKHLYDPSIWGPESFYDALAKTQKEYHDKKEKEKLKRTHVEFVTGTKKATTATQDKSSSNADKKSKWDQGPGK